MNPLKAIDATRMGSQKEVLEWLLEDMGRVAIHLNATLEGVDVPDSHRSNPYLILNVSHRFAGALELSRF